MLLWLSSVLRSCAGGTLFSLNIFYFRETVSSSDGGEFLLAWSNVTNITISEKPIVFVYPGLVSTTKTNYVNELSSAIVKKDYAVVVLINRGLETPCLVSLVLA